MINDNKGNIKLCVFGGGRGTNTIIKSLLKYDSIDVTVIINTYDDGLSTGRLREFIPGMLGPSDVRKNLTNALEEGDKEEKSLAKILEYRIDSNLQEDEIQDFLFNFPGSTSSMEIKGWGNASHSSVRFIQKYLEVFMKYYKNNSKKYDLRDSAIGNLVFAGIYLENKDFNESIDLINNRFTSRIKILNITDGKNLFLSGFTDKDRLVCDEASIVNLNSKDEKILDIYLLEEKIDLELFENMMPQKIHKFLKSNNQLPKLNDKVVEVISQSDLIVYGPGTPFSSLFPTYITEGLARPIVESSGLKIFIGNAKRDTDSLAVSPKELVEYLKYFLNSKGQSNYPLTELIDILLMGKVSESEELELIEYLKVNGDDFDFRVGNWVSDAGKHLGDKILNELNLILNRINMGKSVENVTKVSIVIPVLNECKTITQTLDQIFLVDWLEKNISIEVLVVDGGSTDGTVEILNKNKSIRYIELQEVTGRGAAITRGISESRGDLICTFHADLEYRAEDIIKLINAIKQESSDIIIGSRTINKGNKNNFLRNIYKEKNNIYYLSRYGGIMIMMLSGLLYNKWISDPLTGLKIFWKKDIQNFNLRQKGLALETEFIVQAYKNDLSISEVPISYFPRSWNEGKKSTILDGMKSIWTLIYGRIK
jgi:2-phospho-L-lactate transferase/gluconeogenesis factor (CofD/UPF0052 family)